MMLTSTLLMGVLAIAIPQGRATYDPRAACGPRKHFVQPVNIFETSVNLSDDDKRGRNCRSEKPKTLHAVMKRPFVTLH